jgi:nitrogen fixation protein NifX
MRVAFTSSDGERIDEHFGNATRFYLWDVEAESAACVRTVEWPAVVEDGKAGEDRIVARATALTDCALVCTLQIGGPAAAKLVARHIHPLKTQAEIPISEMVGRLQNVLRGDPPPWLGKAVGAPVQRRHSELSDEE